MRKRNARVGMEVVHVPSGEPLGMITEKMATIVKLDGGARGPIIAAYGEIRPA